LFYHTYTIAKSQAMRKSFFCIFKSIRIDMNSFHIYCRVGLINEVGAMEQLNYNVRVLTVIEMTYWINDHIKTEIQASDVTQFSGYTHWHFQRLFREVTGYTLSEYIRMSRVLNVATALANSRNKITHICYDNGFSSQQSLARLFRRYCGCTPSEFRARVIHDRNYLAEKMTEILKSNGKSALCQCELTDQKSRKFVRDRPHTPDLARLTA